MFDERGGERGSERRQHERMAVKTVTSRGNGEKLNRNERRDFALQEKPSGSEDPGDDVRSGIKRAPSGANACILFSLGLAQGRRTQEGSSLVVLSWGPVGS